VKPLRGPQLPPKALLVYRAFQYATQDQFFKAMPLYEELIEHGDPPPEILSSYAATLQSVGRMDEAAMYYRRAMDLKPGMPTYLDNMIFCVDHSPDTTQQQALDLRREWWHRFGQAIAKMEQKPHTNDRDPERPLRVGYVSGDFRSQSASFSYHMVLMRHSPAVKSYCYFTAPAQAWDEWSSIYSQETTLRHVFGQDALTIAEFIRRDQIDILVDLAAYSNHGRLDVFCLKPAPIQVTAWGYILGTGLDTMDYIFGDPVALPHRDQPYFTEKIVHLPVIIPYVGPAYGPEPNPLPTQRGEPFTFGAFSRPSKVNAGTLRLWGDVLRAVPRSRLLFKSPLTEHKEYQRQVMRGLGVEAHRVTFEGYSPHDKHLAAWHKVDLSLDPYPAGGGVTLAESLWMGVPAVTRVGERIVNRIAPSIYGHLGLGDFLAADDGEYVAIARRWATEGVATLAQWRGRLRGLMFKSPLAQGYVEAVEATYRELWRGYLEKDTTPRESC
jgi:predicted O-linked N-acetylglucosamine transferase (SPINDLY family)